MAEAAVTRVIEIDVRQSATAQAHVAAMSKSLSSIDDTAKKTQGSVQALSGEFSNMASSMAKGLAFGALTTGLVAAVASFRDMIDTTQVLRGRLEQVFGSTEKAGKGFDSIIAISVRQGQGLKAVSDLYEKIGRQQEQLGLTTLGISKLTEGFAASLRLSGAGSEQASAAILQFSQALASGKLAGDEFRSMMENNSVFMYKLAESAGITMGALKDLSKKGGIDLEFLRENLFKLGKDGKSALDVLIESAAKLPMTFKQAMEGVYTQLNNLVDALVNTGSKAQSIFTRMARFIGDALGQAAIEVRMYQGRAAAQAAGEAGKSMPSVDTSPTDFERFVRNNTENIAKDLDKVKEKEKELARVQKDGSDWNRFHQKENIENLNREINGLKERIRYTRDSNAELVKQRSLLMTPELGSELTPGWKPPPKPPPKPPKTPRGGGSSARDALYEFQDSLMQRDLNQDYKNEGMGPNELKLEEAIGKSKLKGKELEDMIVRLREEAKDLDYSIRMLSVDKALTDRRDDLAKTQAELAQKRIQTILAKAPAQEKKVDMLGEFLTELDDLNKVISDIESKVIFGTPDQLAALKEYRENLNLARDPMAKLAKEGKSLAEEIRDAMVSSTKEMANAIVDFATGTQNSFAKMLANILKQIASAQLQKALNPLMSQAGNWLGGLVKGLGGGSASAGAGGFDALGFPVASAKGRAFSNTGMEFFGNGGVFGSPMAFGMAGGRTGVMGEAGAEAIMPLQRDASGKLGIGTAPVSIQINNYSGAQISQSESVDPNGNKRISIMVEKAIEDGIATGRFDKTMRSSYGLARQGR